VTRKKKHEPKKPAKAEQPAEKPACDLTTAEAIERLFPRPAIDAVRKKLEPPPRPGFEEQ